MIANIYLCTFKSDKGVREVKVIANTFARAACIALESTSVWEDAEAYELINIHLSDICFINEKSY